MPRADTCVLYHVPARGLSRRGLREFARRLQEELTGGRAFCCLVTSDEELRRLNKQFRKKDYVTDVLSFPEASGGSVGELAISWGRAQAQAAEYGHTTDDEIRILMLHGVLHLIGMDHEKDGGMMARSEARWRKRLNLPAGLIERVRS
jgi:probable rRNA maturation factor